MSRDGWHERRLPYLWLLPAVAFVSAVLAMSTWVNALHATAGIAVGWLLTVSLTTVHGSATTVLQTHFQLGYVALALLSGGVVLARKRHLRALHSGRRRP